MLAKTILIIAATGIIAGCALKPRDLRRIDYAECRTEAEAQTGAEKQREVYTACLQSRGYPAPGD